MIITFILPINSSIGSSFSLVEEIKKTVESIYNQSIYQWEILILTSSGLLDEKKNLPIIEYLNSLKRKKKIKVRFTESSTYAGAMDFGVKISNSIVVVNLFPGVVLKSYFAFEVARTFLENPKIKLTFSDRQIYSKNKILNEVVWSDLSYDLIDSFNVVGPIIFFRKELFTKTSSWVSGHKYLSAYGFLMKFILKYKIKSQYLMRYIGYINKVLYSYPKLKNDGDLIIDSSDRIESLREIKINFNHLINNSKNKYLYKNSGISFVIPTKNNFKILNCCIKSIFEKVGSTDFEIIVIDNQSDKLAAKKYYDSLEKIDNIRVIYFNEEFNYSKINNIAFKYCSKKIIGFINDDIEFCKDNFSKEVVMNAARNDIGCVGANLIYPNGRVQHVGVKIHPNGMPYHPFCGMHPRDLPFTLLQSKRNPIAVTGAALFIEAKKYRQLKGMDEINFKVQYNDVDLCLRSLKSGYQNLILEGIYAIHYESYSRKNYDFRETYRAEDIHFREKWKKLPI